MIRGLTQTVVAVALCAVAAGGVLGTSSANAAAWIKDAQNECATSNPFPSPNESIRWFGNCRDGKLDGRGTLIWYRDGAETERNEGVFQSGELDGLVVTKYPDGNVVRGHYKQGKRNGNFVTTRSNGEQIGATYADGALVKQARLAPDQVNAWLSGAGTLPATPPPAAQAPAQIAAMPPPVEEPITGRTAVASPSRQLPPAPKPAAAAPKPVAQAAAKSGSSNFTLGTQVQEAIAPLPAAAPGPAPAAASASMPSLPAAGAPSTAPPASLAPAIPRYDTGTQLANAMTQPTTLSAPVPALPAAHAAPPRADLPPLPILAPATQPAGTTGNDRLPPWMAAGAADPAPVGAQLATAAAPAPAQAYVPQAFPPPPPAISAVDASRQYLASRATAGAAQTASLPGYAPQVQAPAYPALGQSAATLGPAVPAPRAPMSSITATAGGGVTAAGGAEGLFSQGYRMEMSGRFREAEQTYEQIILSYSSTQTAMLANERLNGLRRFTRDSAVKIAERPNGAANGAIAVNDPRNLPRHNDATTAMGGAGAGDLGNSTPNLTGTNVCTQKGLYDRDARWCGLVRADDGQRLSIEIKDIVLPGFGAMGIQSSKCTGGSFLNWFSRGTMVRVPRNCMEQQG